MSILQWLSKKTSGLDWTIVLISTSLCYLGASLVAQLVKNLPAMQETWVWSLGWEDPMEKGMTTHSSSLAWRIPWTEEPGSPWGCKELDVTEWLKQQWKCGGGGGQVLLQSKPASHHQSLTWVLLPQLSRDWLWAFSSPKAHGGPDSQWPLTFTLKRGPVYSAQGPIMGSLGVWWEICWRLHRVSSVPTVCKLEMTWTYGHRPLLTFIF